MATTSTKQFLAEAGTITRLGIPLIISHMAIIGMSATDTVLAGRVSTESLAGLSIGAGIWSSLSVFILGMCGATATIVAHLHGGRRFTRIGFQVHQTAWIGVATALLVCCLLISSRWWLPMIQPAGPVTDIAWQYLSIMTLGCFGFVFTAVLQNSCEAVGDTGVAMASNIIMFSLNIFLDYSLVFGHFGLPALGVNGCAWASVLVYWLTAGCLVVYLQSRRDYRRYHLFSRAWRPRWAVVKQHLNIGVPLALGSGGEVFFFSSIALTVAPFGAVAIASHQVAYNWSAIIYMIPLGFSVAMCIRIAQLRGAGLADHARFSTFAGVKVAIAVGVLVATVTVCCRFWVAEFYTPDPAVQHIASQILLLTATYQIFDAIQVSSWGALRGYGDVKVPMLMQLTSYWFWGFPMGLALAYWADLGVYGFWLGIIAGLMLAAVLLSMRLRWMTARA